MDNLSSKAQAGVVVGFLLVMAIVLYFAMFKGWYEQIDSLNRQITTVQAKINKGRAIQMRIDDFKRQIKEINERLEKLKQILPTKSEAGKFYSNLNKMANENHVNITEIKASARKVNDVYIELPYSLKLKSKYHDIGHFFASLANYPKIINVKDMSMQKVKKGMGKYSVSVSCVASTFIYNEATDPKEIGGNL
jgi:Tfp pilus assembly protein PilO